MASTQGLRGKFKQLMVKYGKVALGVHFSVSAASITGLYIAIKNNVDVESLFDKYHIPGVSNKSKETLHENIEKNQEIQEGLLKDEENKKKKLAATSGGAFALALLCNKALFPVRVPITVVLTPPIARFLARRKMITGVRY